jgi:hypothetical protein
MACRSDRDTAMVRCLGRIKPMAQIVVWLAMAALWAAVSIDDVIGRHAARIAYLIMTRIRRI